MRIPKHSPPEKKLQDIRLKNCYGYAVPDVLEIEKAIEKLPREDYVRLRQWLEDYEIEKDLGASSVQIASLLDAEDGGESQMLEQ